MTIQPHIAQARAQCLRAALDMRAPNTTPRQVLALAEEFEAWMLREGKPQSLAKGASARDGGAAKAA